MIAVRPEYEAEISKYSSREIDWAATAGIVVFACKSLAKRNTARLTAGDRFAVWEVRENFLKRKLALPFTDTELDASIEAVFAKLQGKETIHRVALYYLLASRFSRLSQFHARKL